MSYDLGVWYRTHPISHQEAQAQYFRLCEGEDITGYTEAAGKISAFVEELVSRYPPLGEYPDEETDDCPWSAEFDVMGGHVIIAIAWSRCREISPWVSEAASRHGLVCYDPQAQKLRLPPHLAV